MQTWNVHGCDVQIGLISVFDLFRHAARKVAGRFTVRIKGCRYTKPEHEVVCQM